MSVQAARERAFDLDSVNARLADLSAEQRIEWAMAHLPARQVLSSSFGVQAAVMLHLCSSVAPGMPVVFVDTGYHFAETYRFVDSLCQRLKLDLRVYRADISPGWQEARHGKRWEMGVDGIHRYNQENKVAPMQRALAELDVATWFSGLRRVQAPSRAAVRCLELRWRRFKVHPIVDWSDRDVHRYLTRHSLPYHPLRDQGYLTIGDWHTTRALNDIEQPAQARFHGLLRECGLHQN